MTLRELLDELEIAKNNYCYEDVKENIFEYLTLKLGCEVFAIDIDEVEEVIEMKKVIRIESRVPYIKGMISYKKTLVSLVDLRLRLGMDEKEYDNNTSVIIVNINDNIIGLIVDDILDVVVINFKDISYSNNHIHGKDNYIKGVGEIKGESRKILNLNKIVLFHQLDIFNAVLSA